MQRPPGSDAALVAAMAAGDPAGLDGAYRRYADRLFAYARSIVGDADAAADVVQETFLIASQRVHQVRDPDRLGAWLYTIARNESQRLIRMRKRTTVLSETDEPVLDTDPGRAMHAQQVRELVRAAAGGLGDADREVFELTVRHGLSPVDIANVLGVSTNHAHARMSRARTQFEGALGALLVARSASDRCATLADLLKGWDGRLTVLLRKRIDRHARDCDICSDERRDRMRPAELLAAYSALPFLAIADRSGASAARQTGASAEPATRLLSRAEPPHAEPVRGGTGRALMVGAVAVAILLAVGAAAGLYRSKLLAEPSGSPSPVAISAGPETGLVAPSVESSAPTTPTTTPGTPVTVIIVPFKVTASVQVQSCSTFARVWMFEADTSAGTLKNATLHYVLPPAQSTPMTVSGNHATKNVTLSGGNPQVTWWVVATATDGRTAETPHVTSKPCP